MAFNNPKPAQQAKTKGASGGGELNTLVKAEKMMQIAFVLPVSVLVGWLGGVGLDRWLHQDWIYIPGILLGAAAGFIQIFKLVLGNEGSK